jgi:hypothetical protein
MPRVPNAHRSRPCCAAGAIAGGVRRLLLQNKSLRCLLRSERHEFNTVTSLRQERRRKPRWAKNRQTNSLQLCNVRRDVTQLTSWRGSIDHNDAPGRLQEWSILQCAVNESRLMSLSLCGL